MHIQHDQQIVLRRQVHKFSQAGQIAQVIKRRLSGDTHNLIRIQGELSGKGEADSIEVVGP